MLLWFRDYLSNRKQRVVINGHCSEWQHIKAGVPQGSILGPLLFIVFINDIVKDIDSSIKLFADDTSLYIIVDDPIVAAEKLNSDINRIHDWSMNWLVKFNAQKTESMVISRKFNKPFHPPIYMDNTIIQTVKVHRHLGLNLTDDGTWGKHIDLITKKAFNRVNILRKFKFILDRKTLEKIYLTYIRPLLEYGDVIWDTKALYLTKKLENVQIEAARIVTGSTRLVSIDKLYVETGWERLSVRREQHRLVYFYKMVNNLTPNYLAELVPQSFENIHEHNTRNSSIIPPVRSRTALYSNYFLPQTVRSWNLLPVNIKNSTSVHAFKSHFKSNMTLIPSYFYVGKRLAQVFHCRMRLECSSLNSYLFRKNIVNSPDCACGAIETNDHFLLRCPRYDELRIRYITSINVSIRLNSHILLNGSPTLTREQNTDIFLAVQKYILASKRFTSN